VPFGFAAGVVFNLDLDTFAWAGEVGNRLMVDCWALVHVVLFLQVVESAA